MTREANVGPSRAVSAARRARFSASTFSNAGRAWLASMRPKGGSDSNSSRGLFTAAILSDVRQHPGESGGAAHEPADSGEGAPSETLRERFAVGYGQQESPAIRGIAQHVNARRQRLRRASLEYLLARGRARLLPFRAVQAPVMVAVEAREQRGLVVLPLMQQFGHRVIGVLDAGAADTAKRAERAHMLVRLQSMLGIAVFVGHACVDQPAEDSGAVRYAHVRPLRRPVPHVGGAGKDLGAARIDQALTGAVVQKERRLAGVALYRGPRTRPPAAAAFLDFVAPPSTGDAGQWPLVLGIRRHRAAAAELDIALRRGADA